MRTAKKIILIWASITSSFLYAEIKEEHKELLVPSKIQEVTLFKGKAAVQRTANFSAQTGNIRLLFSGLSPYIDASTIRLQGDDSYFIVDVEFRKNYHQPLEQNPKLTVLKGNVNQSEMKIEEIVEKISNIDAQINFLKLNQDVSGKNQPIKLEDLKAISSYFFNTLGSLGKQRLQLSRDLKKEKNILNRWKQELQQIERKKEIPTGEIIVTINSKTTGNKNILLHYLTGNANWNLSYDVHADVEKNNLQIFYKANIRQNTGVDWQNIKLTLSTSSAQNYNSIPQLQTHYLDFWQPRRQNMLMMESQAFSKEKSYAKQEDNILPVQEQEKAAAVEYRLEYVQNLSSQEKEHLLIFKSEQRKAQFLYKTVPLYVPKVFLTAVLEESLSAGQMNLFVENTYTGKTYFNPQQFLDKIEIAMGEDQQIFVKRELVKQYHSRKFLGSNMIVTKGWRIVLRNSKKRNIAIEVIDQIPVSTQKEIVVDAKELSDAQHNIENGQLTWKKNLAANQNAEILFHYEVKFPKDKKIDLP